MTLNPAVERVVSILKQADFRLRPRPVKLGSIEFDFAAVMTAERGLDLVVVADTAEQPIDRVERALQGLSRALDRLQSRRPITLVLVGPRPTQGEIAALSRFGRVLFVGTPTGDIEAGATQDVLAVLLPLNVPDVVTDIGSNWDALQRTLVHEVGVDIALPLLQASSQGSEGVRSAARRLIVAAIESVGEPQ